MDMTKHEEMVSRAEFSPAMLEDSFESKCIVTDETQKKSKNQLKNEAKKREKLEKYVAKQQKLVQAPETGSKRRPIRVEALETVDCVVLGEMKDVLGEMPDSYHPRFVESYWYAWWEKRGVFRPEAVIARNPDAKMYVIAIPPPNVTGSLHLGHAMSTSIQDALIRWKRMKGYAALYVPGCDHAGISCQVVVEKMLKKTKSLTRHDLGREAFLDQVWEWKNMYGDRIYNQFKRLGGSMDWSRVKFTLDASMNKAVTEAFVRLFDQGIIYRDNRLVNWSAALQTTVSDLEVDHIEFLEPVRRAAQNHDPKKQYEFGYMYSFAMKIVGQASAEIVVSTTRPETIPGDVAVAVNPNDPRYKEYKNAFVFHPIRKITIPIVFDEYADMTFGTGAVKITPAHDANDFEVGNRHSLPILNIFDDNNRLNENAGAFSGMLRFDAREAILASLEEQGLLRGKIPHRMTLPICNRSGDIIEPRIRPQWWLKMSGMAAKAVEAVKSKKLVLYPPEADKIWFNWLENSRDWCLSRQLWWGHRVPAYSISILEDGKYVFKKWIAACSMEEAQNQAKMLFEGSDLVVEQDEDVLDTWFSSGLWPFATLGWPDQTADYEKFYPTSVLETGRDIIFFWVARMVMLGIELTGQIPFHTVFLHSIVRDAHGRKMSKSLGNVIDPIDVIEGISLEELHQRLEDGNLDPSEISRAKASQKKDFPHGIPECGTDALRFALCNYTSQGSDVNLDIQRVEGYRRFCNKLWNLVRFSRSKFVDFKPYPLDTHLGLFDTWIIKRLSRTAIEVNRALEDYNFMKATSSIYSFILYDLCDVYVEAIKPILLDSSKMNADEETRALGSDSLKSRNVLFWCIDHSLKLIHPFMPFISEELWQRIPKLADESESISLSVFPESLKDSTCDVFADVDSGVGHIQAIAHVVRSLNKDKLKDGKLRILTSDVACLELMKSQKVCMQSLIKRDVSFGEILEEGETGSNFVWVDPSMVFKDVDGSAIAKCRIEF